MRSSNTHDLLTRIAVGDNMFHGGTYACALVDDLVKAGYVALVRAERSPNGRRWYQITDRGREELDG